MEKRQYLVLIGLMSLLLGEADAKDAVSSFSVNLVKSSDDVNFNIASDLSGTQTPNILSELRWDNMETWRLEGKLRYGLGKRFKILADVGFGVITNGEAIDRDFFGDNRTMEFSRATASVDGKHHILGKVGFGWEMGTDFEMPLWRLGDSDKRIAIASEIRLMPTLGYKYSKQEIEFTDGIQIIPDFGPFEGLNSDFDPEFRGVFFGFESDFRIFRNAYLVIDTNYWIDVSYKASATWNLRSDLAQPESFRQTGEGDGLEYELGLNWKIGTERTIGITYSESDVSADSGSDEVITSQGVSLYTRLNKVEWLSRVWRLSFEWQF